MSTCQQSAIPPPKAWNEHVKTAILHAISLAQYAMASARGQATDSINPRMRQQAQIDRVIKTLKDEAAREFLVPCHRETFRRELLLFRDWYNEHRPRMTLGGETPNEVYFTLGSSNQRPRIESRKDWPRGSPCAKPQTLVAGQSGDRFTLQVDFHEGRRHLPIVALKCAA